jgi:signal transduction histidine kinase
MRIGNLWVEGAIFVLLVCTAAAIMFRSALVERHLVVDPATAVDRPIYAYSDLSSGGRSVASVTDPHSLSWACEIKPGYAYPFCGFGLELNRSSAESGLDLSGFSKVSLDISYAGPSKRLKFALKNRDLVNGRPVTGEDSKPIVVEFDLRQGRQTIELNLANRFVEAWWAEANAAAMPRAGEARLDNVIALDIHTASDASTGLHRLSVHRITFSGSAFTVEQWYLLLLGIWIGLTALLLVCRLVILRRTLAARQRRYQREAQYLEGARQAAESASRAKSRFLAHMSHELRTPLNAILGYAQMLRSADLDDRQKHAAQTIYDSGEHLLTLISDILDHSKIAAGKLELKIASLEVRELVRTVIGMVRGRADEKALRLTWTIAADVPGRVLGDEKHLRQILINLLGNAVKFTRSGEVVLEVRVTARESGNVKLRFEVRDTGDGIPQAKQSLIFQPFEQAGGATSNAGGTGLGLSISQQLVQSMGGFIDFASCVGEGSRFWFDLSVPLDENVLLPRSEPAAEAEAISLRRSPLEIPSPDALQPFLLPARSGNMREIRAAAEVLISRSPEHREFYQHVIDLARNYQSTKLLELFEKNCRSRLAA